MSRASKKNYYEVLGVDKAASDKDIRKAYRKLARKYHPDLNPGDKGSESRFKELSEAYEVLGDAEKRKQYDNPPQAGFNFNGGMGGFDFGQAAGGRGRRRGQSAGFSTADFGNLDDLLGNFFRGGRGGPGAARQAPATEDTESEVTIPLDLAYAGGMTSLTLSRRAPCTACNQAGYTREGICGRCAGQGVVQEQESVKVKIPAGVYEGTRIRVPGKGAGDEGDRGNLFLKIHLAPDDRFRVDGRDVLSRVEVPAWDAALGGDVTAQTLAGPVRLKVPAGSASGTKLRLGGRGLGKGEKKGDHFVEIGVTVPKELSAKQRELFEELKRQSGSGA